MTLNGNKLIPADGMYLKRKSDGTVAEGVMYIPSSLSIDDFTEITSEDYLKLIQQADTDDTTKKINKLEQQINANSTEITNLQEALCEVYETII